MLFDLDPCCTQLKTPLVDLKNQLFNPLPDDNILDWSKLKQIADDIWKYI